MAFRSFDEIRTELERYMPLPRALRSADTLETMRGLMNVLGDPQETYKIVHVAGTSGKTSTSYYAAAMLTATGRKIGLTVSPHIHEMNERLQLDMVPLEEARYCSYFTEFMEIVTSAELHPTYFELLIAFAYWVFSQEKVDYAVIEVGIGGLLDATNVIQRRDKTCVVTDIGLDHTGALGQTVTEIAAHKSGIIRPHNTVFMYEQDEAIMDVVREVSSQQQAELHEVWPLQASELPKSLPLFQRRNWYLAWTAVQYVIERDGLDMLSAESLAQTSETYIPARMEILRQGKKLIVLDGAHNAQKFSVLAESLRARFPKATFTVIFGLARSKNMRLKSSIREVVQFADWLIITSYSVGLSKHRISANPAKVAENSHLLGFDDWEIITSPFDAYKAALKRPEDIVVITGSFFMIDQLKSVLYKK